MASQVGSVGIAPCLWFDGQAEEAARFYTSVVPGGRVGRISRVPDAGQEVHGRPAGSALAVEFELAGTPFTALNGGPLFKFTEAVSLQLLCDSQAEVDRLWDALSEGGDPAAQQCGWLKDKYGLSWQVVPRRLIELMSSQDRDVAARVMSAMLMMQRLDIDALEAAAAG